MTDDNIKIPTVIYGVWGKDIENKLKYTDIISFYFDEKEAIKHANNFGFDTDGTLMCIVKSHTVLPDYKG